MFDKNPVSTKNFFNDDFKRSLFEKLIWKSCRPQNKTFTRGASPGISYMLQDKDAIGGRSWYIATQERKICDMETDIVTFVINGSMKLTVPPDRQ